MNRAIRITSLVALGVWLGLGPAGCSRHDKEARTDTQTQSQSGTAPQVQVSQIDLGRGVGSDKRVTDPTTEFRPNETIYATVQTNGNAPNATMTARWTYQDGQVVEETTQAVAPGSEATTEFHISKPDGWPAGKYKLEVLVNGTPAATKEFEVKTQS